MNNEDFSEVQRIEESHGFLYSRYYLEIEPKENIKQEEYISDIAMLLEKLWSLGYKAICASDFEEELPRKGGYRYENR